MPNCFSSSGSFDSGEMIITNTGGWMKELVEEHHCGFHYPPEEPERLIEKLMPMLEDKQALRTYQQNARLLAETQFDEYVQIKKLIDILHSDDK